MSKSKVLEGSASRANLSKGKCTNVNSLQIRTTGNLSWLRDLLPTSPGSELANAEPGSWRPKGSEKKSKSSLRGHPGPYKEPKVVAPDPPPPRHIGGFVWLRVPAVGADGKALPPGDKATSWCWRADFVAEVRLAAEMQGLKLAVLDFGPNTAEHLANAKVKGSGVRSHLGVVGTDGSKQLWSPGFMRVLEAMFVHWGFHVEDPPCEVRLTEDRLRKIAASEGCQTSRWKIPEFATLKPEAGRPPLLRVPPHIWPQTDKPDVPAIPPRLVPHPIVYRAAFTAGPDFAEAIGAARRHQSDTESYWMEKARERVKDKLEEKLSREIAEERERERERQAQEKELDDAGVGLYG
eukprot:gnl/TRDRNA2_/TRDRNA2_85056_c0_seq1.p1 gnl/TRDRNA2_/TRDRNA2_85056_c0~~gnl/TRDRNA2_/TRDRNA2_85056_c0_seq1.p1  ORF type:complete len:350 (-),score=63.64 gnl/TRDRNA2_/TRDRNA2_85056_c0_seq1:38-1087(-)